MRAKVMAAKRRDQAYSGQPREGRSEARVETPGIRAGEGSSGLADTVLARDCHHGVTPTDYRPGMWYNTNFEPPQTTPSREPAETQLVNEGPNAVPQRPKASASATPGSEYWLP
jgi:hypothetical protein